jgi:RNAse (barnase) inhibitor barstar
VWGVHRRAYQKGVDAEHLRVNEVFHATTRVIYGGSVKAVWDCVNGHMPVEAMNIRLREAQERKEALKKRIDELEAT